MAATHEGLQQRNHSLVSLEKDKMIASGRGNSHLQQFPVVLVFLIAPYEKTVIGEYSTKKFRKIAVAGSTGEAPLLLTDKHANELALLQWLFERLRVTKEHTGGKPPCAREWQVCTTAIRGTTSKPGSWRSMPWKDERAVTLFDYKQAVHLTDGKEKYAERACFLPAGSLRTARRVLTVLAVAEVQVGTVVEGGCDTTPRPSSSGMPYEDDEDLFVAQPSSPVQQTKARPDVVPGRHRFPFPSLSPVSVATESAPSRLHFSAIASAGTARPSTAASSVVELSSADVAGLDMTRFAGGSCPGAPPATPPGLDMESRSEASDVEDLFVHPAYLTMRKRADEVDREEPASPTGPATPTPGAGFVDADVHDYPDAFQDVGRKRKVPSPAQSESNGKPKQGRPKRTKKQTAKARDWEELATTRARQSVRAMARSNFR